jgi:pimeloyl-ACP methyl ester carboxylesterase
MYHRPTAVRRFVVETRVRFGATAAVCLFVVGASVFAQEAPLRANPHAPPAPDPALLEHPATGPTPPVPAAESVARTPVLRPAPTTRLDMGCAFMRFERALAVANPVGDDLARANREFDDATFAFFRGAGARAVADLDASTLRMSGMDQSAAAKVLPWLRVRVTPPVWTYYSSPAPAVVIRGADGAPPLPDPLPVLSISVQPVEAEGSFEATPRARGVFVRVPDVAAARSRAGVSIDLSDMTRSLPPGRYGVSIVAEGGLSWPVGWWTVVSAARADVRAALQEKLDGVLKVRGGDASLRDAFTQFRARLSLVKDKPSETSTSEFLSDPNALENELTLEVRALGEGLNPYRNRAGLVYGAFLSGSQASPVNVPVWTFAPADAVKEGAKPALVIALHGAGAEESMFMFGYGEGVIRTLAQEKGFIVAAPLAYAFTANPEVLDDLLVAMKSRFDFDESRVYLVGHSMGAIAASGLAQARAEKIAGVAAIAGLRPFTVGAKSTPVLAYAAELDRIIPAARVRSAAEAARDAGLPVELREAKGQGHTLVVGGVLRECVEWLMLKRLGGGAAQPSR